MQESLANEDFNLLNNTIANFFHNGLGESSYTAMKLHLEKRNKGYLVKYINTFGKDLAFTDKPEVIRGQFLKAYQAEKSRQADEILRLQEPELKKIRNNLTKLLGE